MASTHWKKVQDVQKVHSTHTHTTQYNTYNKWHFSPAPRTPLQYPWKPIGQQCDGTKFKRTNTIPKWVPKWVGFYRFFHNEEFNQMFWKRNVWLKDVDLHVQYKHHHKNSVLEQSFISLHDGCGQLVISCFKLWWYNENFRLCFALFCMMWNLKHFFHHPFHHPHQASTTGNDAFVLAMVRFNCI